MWVGSYMYKYLYHLIACQCFAESRRYRRAPPFVARAFPPSDSRLPVCLATRHAPATPTHSPSPPSPSLRLARALASPPPRASLRRPAIARLVRYGASSSILMVR